MHIYTYIHIYIYIYIYAYIYESAQEALGRSVNILIKTEIDSLDTHTHIYIVCDHKVTQAMQFGKTNF